MEPSDLGPILHADHSLTLTEGVNFRSAPGGQYSGGIDNLWVYPLFLSILFWSVLAWTRFTPWLHFPEDTRGCMYHFSGYLRDNWWHTEWTMTDRGLGEALR